jgi:hypothetical protein
MLVGYFQSSKYFDVYKDKIFQLLKIVNKQLVMKVLYENKINFDNTISIHFRLGDYKKFAQAVKKPILANITEFGLTPLFTRDQLASQGVAMILYPLSAFRAMNKAAENVYETIRRDGTQSGVIGSMQSRDELYERINYHAFEKALDQYREEK